MPYVCARPRWVVPGVLAVSPMPCPDDVETLADEFNTVVSLATWVEHASRGFDPRILEGYGVRFVWLPVGEYNAPPLPALVKALGSVREPVLVHCFRGCGRAAVFAASLLIAKLGSRLPEALATVSSTTGCSVETLPQLTVLKALDYAARLSRLEWLAGFRDSVASCEYALLLARELGGEPEAYLPLGESLEKLADYTISGVEFSSRSRSLRVVCWVERGAHPISARRVGCPEDVRGVLVEFLAGRVGEVVVENLGRDSVPWL